MFVGKLGTPSCSNYEHFHVYLAYRRQTGTVVTRQTYDRAPRLTKPPTAHISRGEYYLRRPHCHGDQFLASGAVITITSTSRHCRRL